MGRRILWLMLDFTIAALFVAVTWVVEYRIPHAGVKAQAVQKAQESPAKTAQDVQTEEVEADTQDAVIKPMLKKFSVNIVGDSASEADTGQEVPVGEIMADSVPDWRGKFAEHFTAETVATDLSYSSPNLAIQLSYHQYDTGIVDPSDSGKHKKYGSQVSYVIADIYVGDITCFQAAFAQDTYGVGYSEKLSEMSRRMRAVLAVNGDSYSNNRHRDNGTIIRNGVVYRNESTDAETFVLNWDGTVDIYAPGRIALTQLADKGAYQSWIFGPSLLDGDGKAKGHFLTWNYIRQSHPRTAIGYYEPGHYCLLLVDGRQESTRGMFLEEMAQVFEGLGCKAAYNLDGGHCSFMTFQGKTANHPYKPEHEVADGILITEGV